MQCRALSRAVMDEKSLSPLFPVRSGGGWWGQWLQMPSALHVCKFITQSPGIIPYAEVDWSWICNPSGEQQVPFLLFLAHLSWRLIGELIV